MTFDQMKKKYLPMTETAYYILLSLTEVRHGYAIMQYVEEMTQERLSLGAGTLYGSLSKMEPDGLIQVVAEEDRRKYYQLTEEGRKVLHLELQRLKELVAHGIKVVEEAVK